MTKDTTDLFVDIAADSLHATSTSEPSDGRLRDALDVLTHDLSVSLRATFAETLTTFAASRHPENWREFANFLTQNGGLFPIGSSPPALDFVGSEIARCEIPGDSRRICPIDF
jgi:hypothetical protein